MTPGHHAGDSPPRPFEGEEQSDAPALPASARIVRSLVPILKRLRRLGKVDQATKDNVVRDTLDDELDLQRGGTDADDQ